MKKEDLVKCPDCAAMRSALELFCQRRDRGEIQSTTTYKQFKQLLNTPSPGQSLLDRQAAALGQCEQLFNYLNNKGGLGLDVHDLIRKVLDEVKSVQSPNLIK